MTFVFDDKTGLTPEEQASVQAGSRSNLNRDPGLPGELDEIAWAIHRDTDANISLVRMQILSTVASCLQGHYNGETHWGEAVPYNIFTFAVAVSNERKSAAFHKAMKGPYQWDKQAELDYKNAKADYESDKAQAKKDGLEFNGQPPVRDIRKTSDPTIEAVISDMESPNGVMIWAEDEAAKVVGGYSMSRETAMRTFGVLNEIWQGRTYTMRRRTQGNVRVETPRLTISWAGQPNTAYQLLGNKDAEGTGFLARFLFLNPPPRRDHRDKRQTLTMKDEAKIQAFKDWTLQWMNKPLPMDETDVHCPYIFPASQKAKGLGKAFEEEMERASDPGQKYHELYQAGKAHDQAYRIAGIFALFRGARELEAEDMTHAIALVRFYLDQVLAFMDDMAGTQAGRDMDLMLRQLTEIQEKRGDLTQRTLNQYLKRPFKKDPERTNKTLAALDKADLIKKNKGPRGGQRWEIK